MSDLDAAGLHSALVAKVTEYLNIAEAATSGGWRVFGSWLAVAVDRCTCAGFEPYGHEPHCGYEPMTDQLHEPDAECIAAHSPAFAILVHRQALETLNRHHPELQREWVPPQYAPNPPGPAIETRPAHMWEHWVCDGCDIWTNMGEAQREYENCPEVAGVRAVYLPEE